MAKILVVEDDVAQLEIACELLQGEGYEVVSVDAGKLAAAAADAAAPDLILMDLQCPDLEDGLRAISDLRAQPSTRDAVIVAMSAVAGSQYIDNAIRAGCDGYVVKPYDFDEFLATVAKHLQPEAS